MLKLPKSVISKAALLLTLTGGALLVACSDPGGAQLSVNSLLIQNITAIDAVHGMRENVDVLVIEGKIKTVGEHESIDVITADILEGTGKYIIPGLWDAHVHLAYSPEITYETFFPLSLAYGITSLRDTGGHLDLLAPAIAAAASDAITPDLYISGPLIDGPLRVYAGQSASNPDLSVGVTTAEEAKMMVDDLAAAGVNFVKAYEMLSPEAFKAAAAQARKHNLPVAAHIPLSMSVMEAIEAGANDMQHLRNIEFDCAANAKALKEERQKMLAVNDAESPAALRGQIHSTMRALAIPQQDDLRCQAVIKALSDANVYQTPTLVVSRFFSRKLFADERYRQSFDLMPQATAQSWKDRSAKLDDYSVSAENAAFDDWVLSMIPRLRDGGVPIMVGTDAPIGFLTPGASLHEELAELVSAGLSPLEAIGSATLVPAKFLKLDNEVGAISPNMRADLVVLDENPLENIRNINSIYAVIKGGHLLDRGRLVIYDHAPQETFGSPEYLNCLQNGSIFVRQNLLKSLILLRKMVPPHGLEPRTP